MTRNLLGDETSPYLLQHKDNPVHWRPWSAESLALAKAEDKPILLSVGYAACHWCHVMAHESFEDGAIAEVMNELFVNVKVDREERPDVDAIYQAALQMMGEHGGWPLTMFLTPDGAPFWGGTYFPSSARYGRPAFTDILRGIANAYGNDRDKVLESAGQFRQGLAKLATPQGGGALSLERLDQVAGAALRMIDPIQGGTQGAPKFPQPSFFLFLWRAYRRLDSEIFRQAVTVTLDHICQGGIYDHLGGGFARYSTDDRWLAPHFEKMLYDNALLIELLTVAWHVTKSPLYAARVAETIDWALREMRSVDDGPFAFTSALDADSEGEEGKFYVWSEDEIDAVLGDGAAAFKETYDVTPGGNWEGKTILNRSKELALGDDKTEAALARAREKLLAVRGGRVRPQRDDKVLADWNGLMIAALAKAGAVFDRPDWIEAARAVFAHVVATMTEDAEGEARLRHSWCAGQLRHPAVVDDYANMARAALVLDGVTGNADYRAQARAWVETADKHYWDGAGQGYFLSADDTDDVIARSKSAMDNAVPSGNGVMAEVLARLHHLTGEDAYRERAEALIAALAGPELGYQAHQPTLLMAFEMLVAGVQVIIVGGGDETAALRRAVFDTGLENRIVTQLKAGADLPGGHPAHGKGQAGGKPTAYVCVGPTCGLPVTDVEALREQLGAL